MSDEPSDERWAEVNSLRNEAVSCARRGDMLAASMLDAKATELAESIRELPHDVVDGWDMARI